jgi:hypothetical protein
VCFSLDYFVCRRAVSFTEGRDVAALLRCVFVEVSARTAENMNNVMHVVGPVQLRTRIPRNCCVSCHFPSHYFFVPLWGKLVYIRSVCVHLQLFVDSARLVHERILSGSYDINNEVRLDLSCIRDMCVCGCTMVEAK